MIRKRYALLDTDFVSKMHLIGTAEGKKMIDMIIAQQEYEFFCHEQIKIELKRHNIADSYQWLNEMIDSGRVKCLSDKDILSELKAIYGKSFCIMYANMLQNGCNAFKRDYFDKKFCGVNTVDFAKASESQFCAILKNDCDNIGQSENLGEIKTYVLLQLLKIKYGNCIYVFCSDDKNARNGIVSIGGAKCMSILTAILKLYTNRILSKADAEPYYNSYIEFCHKHGQDKFKVYDTSKNLRAIRLIANKYSVTFLMANLWH